MSGAWGGLRGNVTVEKGPAISFVRFSRSQIEQEDLKSLGFRLKMTREPTRIEEEEE